MLIINNRFLSLYDYNFLLVIEKIRKRNSKICGSRIPNVILFFLMFISSIIILRSEVFSFLFLWSFFDRFLFQIFIFWSFDLLMAFCDFSDSGIFLSQLLSCSWSFCNSQKTRAWSKNRLLTESSSWTWNFLLNDLRIVQNLMREKTIRKRN